MRFFVYHIALKQDWVDAKQKHIYEKSTKDKTLADTGFIHLSFKEQIPAILNSVYKNEKRELVLLKIPIRHLKDKIKFEKSDGEIYPHYYGPINPKWVTKESPVA